MTVKTSDTGNYSVQGSLKFWVGMGTALLTLITAVVTYTITITLAFTGVRQDIALINQKMDFQGRASESTLQALDARVKALEAQRDAMVALANEIARNNGKRSAGGGTGGQQ